MSSTGTRSTRLPGPVVVLFKPFQNLLPGLLELIVVLAGPGHDVGQLVGDGFQRLIGFLDVLEIERYVHALPRLGIYSGPERDRQLSRPVDCDGASSDAFGYLLEPEPPDPARPSPRHTRHLLRQRGRSTYRNQPGVKG